MDKRLRPGDLENLLARDPFIPLRLWVSDGAAYDIDENTYAQVYLTMLWIGLDADEGGLPSRTVYIDTQHATRMEVLEDSGKERQR